MSAGEPMGAEDVREAIGVLLAKPSGVFIAALNEDAVVVPIPGCVPCPDQPSTPDSVLDLFAQDDLTEVVRVWAQAKTAGAAAGTVRLHNHPDEPVMLLIADFRDTYGTFLAVLSGPRLDARYLELDDPKFAVARVCAFRQLSSGVIIDIDDAATRMLGWSREDLVGRNGYEVVHPDDHPAGVQAWLSAITSGRPRQVRQRRRRKDGTWLWVEATITSHVDDPDQPHVVLDMVDISNEMAAIDALQERERLLSSLAQSLPVGLFRVDQQRLVSYSNDRLHVMLGTAPTDRLDPLLSTIAGDDRPAFDAALSDVLADGTGRDLEVDVCVADVADTASIRRCVMSLRALFDSAGTVTGAIVCVSDVTEATEMRRELEDRATYDALTRCYNRASVMLILDRVLAQKVRARTAVIFIDADRFKSINDQFGHAAGDELLVTLAYRLRSVLRGGDVLGRIGGDEFLIVCQDVNEADALAIAGRIRHALAEEMLIAGHVLNSTASIGIAVGTDVIGADELVRRADIAMYEAKRHGPGIPVLYSPDLESTPRHLRAQQAPERVR